MDSKSETNIGEILKAWREYRGMRPAELAKIIGASRSYIHQIETGEIKQPNKYLTPILQALDLTASDVYEFKGPPVTSKDYLRIDQNSEPQQLTTKKLSQEIETYLESLPPNHQQEAIAFFRRQLNMLKKINTNQRHTDL